MKQIEEQELSTQLQNKINQFESLKQNYQGNTNYVSYENGTFALKDINALELNKVFSLDDIYNLGDHLYKSEKNFISAYDTTLINNTNSYATSSLLSALKGTSVLKLDSNIVKFKIYDAFFLFLCESGNMYKVARSNYNIQLKKNIVDILKNNYIFSTKFNAYTISDFTWYKNGILAATPNNGIFFISMTTDESSLLIKELNAKILKLLSDQKTLLIANNFKTRNVILYDLEANKKKNIFNNLYLNVQEAIDVDLDKDKFYILGKTHSINQSDHLLHVWELDSAEVDYANIDYYVAPNNSDNDYRPKILKHTDTNVYICGLKNKKLFLWEYIKDNLNTTPLELVFNLQDIEYSDLVDFNKINDRFYITLKNQLLVLDNNLNLLENYLLGSRAKFKFVKVNKNGVYAIDGKELYTYSIPAKNYQKINDITILDETTSCNNIDILIKMSKNNQVLFIDGETGQKFNPYFYMKLKEQFHIIKLTNNNYKKIIMRVGVTEQDKIEAIVIHKNRIFYK